MSYSWTAVTWKSSLPSIKFGRDPFHPSGVQLTFENGGDGPVFTCVWKLRPCYRFGVSLWPRCKNLTSPATQIMSHMGHNLGCFGAKECPRPSGRVCRRTPTAFRPPAQGCDAGATLGNRRIKITTPTGLCPFVRTPHCPRGQNSVGVHALTGPVTQGSLRRVAASATLGYGPDSRWRSRPPDETLIALDHLGGRRFSRHESWGCRKVSMKSYQL